MQTPPRAIDLEYCNLNEWQVQTSSEAPADYWTVTEAPIWGLLILTFPPGRSLAAM